MLNKNKSRKVPKAFTGFKGTELIDKIIDIDQSQLEELQDQIQRRIQELLVLLENGFWITRVKARGYKVGRYSFNVKRIRYRKFFF